MPRASVPTSTALERVLTAFHTWIGQPYDRDDVTALLSAVNPKRAFKKSSGDDHHIWASPKDGLEVHRDKSGAVTMVIAYTDDGDGKRYGGALPDGLSLDMDRAAFKAKFGEPQFKSEEHQCWVFDTYRIVASYDPDDDVLTDLAWCSPIPA